jgi:hypothetical protein
VSSNSANGPRSCRHAFKMPRRRNLWVTDTFERRLEAQVAETTRKRYAVRGDMAAEPSKCQQHAFPVKVA